MASYKNSDTRPPIMQGSPPPKEWRVPPEDWHSPPWNRWSMQHVRQIVPTANISRGAGPVSRLSDAPEDILGIRFQHGDHAISVAEMLDNTYSDGFLVVKNGKVIHESYYNGMTADTVHLAQSVSKSVTASVTGIMIERGQLDPMAQVQTYVPELADCGWNGATLRDVLDMTGGVTYSEEYTDAAADVSKSTVACGWQPIPAGSDPSIEWPETIWDQILSLKACDAPHGARFNYRSIETDVVAHVMERVSGRRLPQLISEELWQPMGAETDANITVDRAGYGLACGGLSASLRDFARFGLLYLNGGKSGARQVLPADWVTDVLSGDHGLFDEEHRDRFPNGRYRNQFWVEDAARQTVLAIGVFGQMIYIAPEHDMVAVKLSSWPDFVIPDFGAQTRRALHAIATAFGPA